VKQKNLLPKENAKDLLCNLDLWVLEMRKESIKTYKIGLPPNKRLFNVVSLTPVL